MRKRAQAIHGTQAHAAPTASGRGSAESPVAGICRMAPVRLEPKSPSMAESAAA